MRLTEERNKSERSNYADPTGNTDRGESLWVFRVILGSNKKETCHSVLGV